MGIILIVILCVAVLIGAITGLVKGYAKTSFWGGTVVFTVLIERLACGNMEKGGINFSIVALIVTAVSFTLFSVLFAIVRKIMNGRIRARRTLSEYENHDELEENEAYILNAVDNNDKKEYKRLRKKRKKIKTKSGVWGVFNRIFGAVSGAFNALVGAFIAVAFLVLFIDLTQISALTQAFESLLTAPVWTESLGKIAFDVIAISLLSLAVRSGYKSGISSVLSTAIIIGLILVFAIASFSIASSSSMEGMVNGLETGLLSSIPAIGSMKHTIAIVVTTVILFLLSLIVIILVAIFLPKFVEKFRENKVFMAIDGVFGAIMFTLFIFALLLAFGGLAYSLSGLPLMEKVDAYMDSSFFADCMYSSNPLNSIFANLPLRAWFGGAN